MIYWKVVNLFVKIINNGVRGEIGLSETPFQLIEMNYITVRQRITRPTELTELKKKSPN